MTIPSELTAVLTSTPDTLYGAVRFAGTRVPVEVLLDSIAEGISLERFLAGYSSVTREQALAVLEWQNGQAQRAIGIRAA